MRSLILFLVTLALASGAEAGPREIAVTFRSDVELSGSVILPEGKGPFPAIIFLHGSGPMTREGFKPYAMDYARMGVASLIFDKRGAGKSGKGPETLAGMKDDALAAVSFMERRSDIDPSRVGFWGISQSGWVISSAMAASDKPDFAIVVSGGGASPLASELFSWDREFDKRDLKESELAFLRSFVRDYYAYFGGEISREQLLERFSQAKAAGGASAELAEFLRPKLPADNEKHLAAWVYAYDPADDIGKIGKPMLVLLGELDTDHPTEMADKAWRGGLAAAGNEDVTIVVFKGAGHGIRMRKDHKDPGRAPFADGYKEVMQGWLWRHVVEKAD